MKKENGFTLIEIIVALFVGSIMLAAIYSAVNSAQRTSTGIERKVIAQQDARSALDLMAMEIRMASYNPNSTTGNWLQTDCSNVSVSQENRGIQEATPTAITVEMDMNGDCTEDDEPICMRNYAGNLNPNEVIRYFYDSNNNLISRAINCGPAEPFLGANAATTVVKTVNVINNTAGTGNLPIPVFRYYNGAGTDISNTVATGSTDPITGIPAIRRVEITLAVETEHGDPNSSFTPETNTRRRLIYSTSVIVRNHVSPTY
jgi:prepilin-type N-terminal cleavage/methylation domain-containing protein